MSWRPCQRWDRPPLELNSERESWCFQIEAKLEQVLPWGPPSGVGAEPGSRGPHSPLQARSSLSSEQSRKPSQRSESMMQASPSWHWNSRAVQVRVLCVAATSEGPPSPKGSQVLGKGTHQLALPPHANMHTHPMQTCTRCSIQRLYPHEKEDKQTPKPGW